MSDFWQMTCSYVQLIAFVTKLEHHHVMKQLAIAHANIPTLVILVLHVSRDSPKIHKLKSATHKVYARPMVEMLIVMVMVDAGSREELLSVPVHLVSKTMDLSNALNVLIQCLITQNAKYDLSLLKTQLSPAMVYRTLSHLHSLKEHLIIANKTPPKVKMVSLIGHRDLD